MKLTDYVVQFLADRGAHHVFGVTGGAVVHLFDSAARSGRMMPVFHHHEQAASFAAEAYARVTNRLGACFVTAGPGATNALTGLAGAWLDSLPCVFISGQARVAHTTRGKKIRQLGTQQLDVIEIVRPLTNYAVMIDDAQSIRFHLEKACDLATRPRPGPVWIDLPLDLQWAEVDPDGLPGYSPPEESNVPCASDSDLSQLRSWLGESTRPLVLAGYGVRQSRSEEEFIRFVETFDIPFVTSWGAADLAPGAHRLHLGRPGLASQRGANLAMQNCDLLIALGSHLCIPITGTMFQSFAREARIVVVDVDSVELDERTVRIDLAIHGEVGDLLRRVQVDADAACPQVSEPWRKACRRYVDVYNAPPKPASSDVISPYQFVKTLSDHCEEGDIVVVDGGGTNVYVAYQTFVLKRNQRMVLTTGLCAMGSGLPESIGACFASGGRRTICVCGDGSFQLNVQELQTIKHHCLPIKLFVTNNDGYISIRHTQEGFLKSNYVGSRAEGGMSLPDVLLVAASYGLQTLRIERPEDLAGGIEHVLASSGPMVCEIMADPDQEVIPRQGFEPLPNGLFGPRPLEDMAPHLDSEELSEVMFVKPWTTNSS